MKITSIRIKRRRNSETRMAGLVSITLDDMFAIHDIKILASNDSYFLAMPSKTVKPGVFKDVAHPINSVARGALDRIVLPAFKACRNADYEIARYDANEGFEGSLTEQSFADFYMAQYKASNDYAHREDAEAAEVEAVKENISEKKHSSFFDWLKK